jgi:hypothetical protein
MNDPPESRAKARALPAGTGHQAALARDGVSDRELITKRVDNLERKLDVLAQAREH